MGIFNLNVKRFTYPQLTKDDDSNLDHNELTTKFKIRVTIKIKFSILKLSQYELNSATIVSPRLRKVDARVDAFDARYSSTPIHFLVFLRIKLSFLFSPCHQSRKFCIMGRSK